MFEDFYNVFNKKYGGMLEIIIKRENTRWHYSYAIQFGKEIVYVHRNPMLKDPNMKCLC